MYRRTETSRWDRAAGAIEVLALGLWLGALCGFAFVFAPIAFRIVTDLAQFAALTAGNLRALAIAGTICGAVAIVLALLRARSAADRTNDLSRALLVLLALGFVAYEMQVIVPAMAAIPDLRSDAYRALHGRSTAIYGGAVLCVAVSLVLAAVRRDP